MIEESRLILVFVRRFNSDEQLVPFVMLTRWRGSPTGKSAVQQLDLGDQFFLHPSPVGKLMAAGAGNLVAKQLGQTLVYTVVVWFDNALPIFIAKPNQASLLNRVPEQEIDTRLGLWRHRRSSTLS